MTESIPPITTAHELNGATLLRLWEEVLRGVPSPMTPEQANKVLGPTMGFFQGLG